LLSLAAIALLSVKDPKDKDPKDKDKGPRQIPLPTSKLLNTPSPGRLGSLNSFPATIALSRDGRYAALLNDGYGTQDDQAHQSIAVLDLNTNQIADFPDDHLPENAHQSYFLGLAFSSDGSHLYASMGSITDPTGEGAGDTGNGIAVYKIQQGKITPERFIKIAPQKIAHDKQVAIALRKTATGTAIPYPAGLTVVSGQGEDKLLVANNLSDNVVLLDPRDGRILEQFDLSTHQMIPASFPYTVVATRDGRHAWCSLWNASQVAELDLEKGTVARWIALLAPKEPTDPGSHPTALLLSPDENLLYVTLSSADKVAVLSTRDARHVGMLYTAVPRQKFAGTYPNALALSAGGKRLFVADASLNAIAVFDVSRIGPDNPVFDLPIQKALGFIPTDWYPSALATVGDDLLIATAKGQGTGPNNGINGLKQEKRRREHPYIATLLYGSLSRLNFRDAEKRLAEFTRQVEDSNLFLSDPGRIQFQRGSNPIRHVIYVIK